MRYSDAFALWDRTGRLWKLIEKDFTKLKANQVQPNEQTFIADDRYIISAGLQRSNLTDHKPSGSAEKLVETVADFANKVLEVVELIVLERVGFRLIYSLPCATLAEAREKSMICTRALPPRTRLFGVDPQSFGASTKLEVDDGDFGYLAHLYPQEKRFDFSPPPDVLIAGLEKREEKTYELVLDFDFSTKKPLRVDAFDCKSWLMGWSKMVSRDADTFLDYLAGKNG
ncbi:MAG: hypothetical protein ACREEK_33800 [Bradyrhizobium sp.]